MRWLPEGHVGRVREEGRTDVEASATVGEIAEGPGRDVPVNVEVKDHEGEVVCRAVITMWVSPRSRA